MKIFKATIVVIQSRRMKNWVFLVVVLLLSLFQSTVWSLNLLLVAVLWLGRYYWAFLAGLVYDLLSGERLGLSSLLFLFILLLFRLYLRKFEPRPLFLAIFTVLASYIFTHAHGQLWRWWHGLVLVLFVLLLRHRFRKERQLKLDL